MALDFSKANMKMFVWDSTAISVWDIDTGHQLNVLTSNEGRTDDNTGYVYKGLLATSETFLASTGVHGTVVTLDMAGNVIQRFAGHSDGVFAVDLSTDDRYLLTGSYDGTVRLWTVQTGMELHRIEP